jgi:hypothetical protein
LGHEWGTPFGCHVRRALTFLGSKPTGVGPCACPSGKGRIVAIADPSDELAARGFRSVFTVEPV